MTSFDDAVDRAFVVTAVRDVRSYLGRLRTAIRRSRIASATTERYAASAGALGRATNRSRVVSFSRRGADLLRRWSDGSALRSTGGRLLTFVEASFLYRWFTAEPEPEVIVIDLRETWTAGPTLRVLERTLDRVAPTAHRARLSRGLIAISRRVRAAPFRVASLCVLGAVMAAVALGATTSTLDSGGAVLALALFGLALLGTRVSMSWEEVTDTRTYRALAAAFEPPEPPVTYEPSEPSQPSESSEPSQPSESSEPSEQRASNESVERTEPFGSNKRPATHTATDSSKDERAN